MLELMSPWEYTAERPAGARPRQRLRLPGLERVRRVGAGARRGVPRASPRGGAVRSSTSTCSAREHEDLYQLAETLTELDERATTWRIRHFKVVERIIGGEVVGTQGTPVELLGGLIDRKLFPELWKVRNELTELAIGGRRSSSEPGARVWGGRQLRADRRGVRADARRPRRAGSPRSPASAGSTSACGTGGVALRAARAGADVTGARHLADAAGEGAGRRRRGRAGDPFRRGATPRRSRTTDASFDVVVLGLRHHLRAGPREGGAPS